MAQTKWEYLSTDLKCLERGHLFTEVVLNELHYPDGYDRPYRVFVPKRTLGSVRCPECGSLAEEAK